MRPVKEGFLGNDTLRRAQNLGVEFPGSSFEQTLMSFGQNGKYLVLVNGPFGNLSSYGVVLTASF